MEITEFYPWISRFPRWKMPLLWFRPAEVRIADGWAITSKELFGRRVIVAMERLPDEQTITDAP